MRGFFSRRIVAKILLSDRRYPNIRDRRCSTHERQGSRQWRTTDDTLKKSHSATSVIGLLGQVTKFARGLVTGRRPARIARTIVVITIGIAPSGRVKMGARAPSLKTPAPGSTWRVWRHGRGASVAATGATYEPQTTYAGRGPKDYQRSDDRIREEICDCMTDDPMLDASEITVVVNKGEVNLSGLVTSRDQKRRAEDVAERISGVKDVTNQLRVSREANGHNHTAAPLVSQASGNGTPSKSTSGTTT